MVMPSSGSLHCSCRHRLKCCLSHAIGPPTWPPTCRRPCSQCLGNSCPTCCPCLRRARWTSYKVWRVSHSVLGKPHGVVLSTDRARLDARACTAAALTSQQTWVFACMPLLSTNSGHVKLGNAPGRLLPEARCVGQACITGDESAMGLLSLRVTSHNCALSIVRGTHHLL